MRHSIFYSMNPVKSAAADAAKATTINGKLQ
jgi:hypothetical protein